MSYEPEWVTAKLFDFDGKEIGAVRLPPLPTAYGVLIWDNRYFRRIFQDGTYSEVRCYLVPLEAMYTQAMPAPPAPQKGTKK